MRKSKLIVIFNPKAGCGGKKNGCAVEFDLPFGGTRHASKKHFKRRYKKLATA